MKINHQHFETLNSTQSYLKEALENNVYQDAFNLISADRQTDGYGRQGRKWNSEHRGLFMSFTLRPNEILTLTSLEIAVLVSHFFREKFQLVIYLKWPNDLIYQDGKCGGILLQTFNNQVIIGIGLNFSDSYRALSSEKFEISPNSLPLTPDSTKDLCLETYRFIAGSRLSSSEIIDQFSNLCVHIDKRCSISQGEDVFEGIFLGCGKNGEAVMQTNDGTNKTFFSGTLRYS